MRIRVFLILAMLILLPLAIFGWLGTRIVLSEQEMAWHQYRELLDSQLAGWDETLHGLITDHERSLLEVSDDLAFTPQAMRAGTRKHPLVVQAFLMNADGKLIYPLADSANTREQEFLRRTLNIWETGELFFRPEEIWQQPDNSAPNVAAQMEQVIANSLSQSRQPMAQQEIAQQAGEVSYNSYQTRQFDAPQQQTVAEPQQIAQQQPVLNVQSGLNMETQKAVPPSNWSVQALDSSGQVANGWYTWYWGSGMHVIFWKRLADGRVFGFELDRSRLVADMIAALPSTTPSRRGEAAPRIALINGRGDVLYQWGRTGEDIRTMELRTDRTLQPPLQGWRLACYMPAATATPLKFGLMLNLAAVLIGVALVLLALGAWLYRETGRETRLASQRVSFVNNVSHELKTPLTNIRMYAELLENTIDEDDARSQRYLDTVVRESRRLSRLIGNVLTFASHQRGNGALQPREVVPDAVIQEVVDQFQPSLDSVGLAIRVKCDAARTMRLDRDALEQILVNLVGNVEKYAISGKHFDLESSQNGNELIVRVRDYGPGIPEGDRRQIFDAFYRASNRLSDGVAGTGIGLSIARDLAQRHGGDLVLLPSDGGACFECRLRDQSEDA